MKKKIIFKEIDVSLIDFSGKNPRRSMRKIKELAENISENGLINPISVKRKKNGRFEIVSGERRFRACTEILKWKKISTFIKNPTKYEMLAENLSREDMNIVEKIPAIAELLKSKFGSEWQLYVSRVMNETKQKETSTKEMKKVLSAIGIKAGTFYAQLCVLSLEGKIIDRILEHPEYYSDLIIMKLARLKNEKAQLKITKSIADRNLTDSYQITKAITKASYQIGGISESTASWFEWEDNLNAGVRTIVAYLKKIEHSKPASKVLLDLGFTIAKIEGAVYRAKEDIKKWEEK